MAAIKFLHALHEGQGLLEAGRVLVEEEVFLEAAGLQDIGKQVTGQLQESQPPADIPVNLVAEPGKDNHGHDAKEKEGDNPAPDFEGGFFHLNFLKRSAVSGFLNPVACLGENIIRITTIWTSRKRRFPLLP